MTINLPKGVNGSKADAKFKDGLLESTIPKITTSKRKIIKITCYFLEDQGLERTVSGISGNGLFIIVYCFFWIHLSQEGIIPFYPIRVIELQQFMDKTFKFY